MHWYPMDRPMGAKGSTTYKYSIFARCHEWKLGWRLALWNSKWVLKISFSSLHFFHLCIIVLVLIWLWVCTYCVGDELVNVWEVGDNLAINVDNDNFKGVYLYLIPCTKTFLKVQEKISQIIGKHFFMKVMTL